MQSSSGSLASLVPSKFYDAFYRATREGVMWRQFLFFLAPRPLSMPLWRVAGAFFLLILESVSAVVVPWLFSVLVARLSVYPDFTIVESGHTGAFSQAGGADAPILFLGLVALLLAYATTSLINGLVGPCRDMLIAPLKASLKRRTALLGLAHLQRLETSFHLNRQTGALSRILDRGAEATGTLVELMLANILPNIISLILTFSVILHVFRMGYILLLLAGIAIYSTISFCFTRLRVKARREKNKANNQVNRHLVDILMNIETVRAFGNEPFELEQHGQVRLNYQESEVRLQYLVSLSQMVRNSLIAVTTALLLGLSAWDIVHHRLEVAQFVLIGTYLRSIYASVGALNYVSAGWRNARVDMENYLELLARKPEQAEGEPIKEDKIRTGLAKPQALAIEGRDAQHRAYECGVSVRFSHVSFAYEGSPEGLPVEKPSVKNMFSGEADGEIAGERGDESRSLRLVLEDISFNIPAGGSLAVVGATGSGKSTLMRLLSRYHEPLRGDIEINGESIKNMPVRQLRGLIGLVPQDCALFNTTIGENIAYGRVGASFGAICDAARQAQLHDFIESLPQGYDTLVGERGVKLSGGERQRVAIARVFLRNPRILVLDEASSALDTRTEAAIQTELTALSKTRTTLMIAHRLSTIMEADHILVLERGRVVEEGTHESLLAREGAYKRMWVAQARSGYQGL